MENILFSYSFLAQITPYWYNNLMPIRYIKRLWAKKEERAVGPVTPGLLARAVEPLTPRDSLHKALHRMRTFNIALVPVVESGLLVGMVSEEILAHHLGDDPAVLDNILVLEALQPVETIIPAQATLAQAEELLRASGESWLPVISYGGYYLGCLYLVDLLAARSGRLYPPRMGGMATPLGVYMTTGQVSGGADWRGLVLTGVLMAFLFQFVQIFIAILLGAVAHFSNVDFIRNLALLSQARGVDLPENSLPLLLITIVLSVLQIFGFLLVLRYGPWLSGYHAAEHQTINAVEKGESLTVESVRVMPRVHPRCGTNLWAIMIMISFGMMVLWTLWFMGQGQWHELIVAMLGLCWAVFTMNRWQLFGAWLQQNFTTRPATQQQLESGIFAAKQVIERHQQCGSPVTKLQQRLWNMGLLQVAVGMFSTLYLLNLLPLDRLWQSLVK